MLLVVHPTDASPTASRAKHGPSKRCNPKCLLRHQEELLCSIMASNLNVKPSSPTAKASHAMTSHSKGLLAKHMIQHTKFHSEPILPTRLLLPSVLSTREGAIKLCSAQGPTRMSGAAFRRGVRNSALQPRELMGLGFGLRF